MSSEWQRLSPWAILFFAARGMKHITNLYPAFIGVFITAQHLDLSWGQIGFYTLCAFVVLVLSATLYYLNFFYIQEDDRFLIRSGIFQKDRLELPFGRIQNITVKEPFYFRPMGLVILNMDSAGSAQKEVGIAALSIKRAEAIKRSIEAFNVGSKRSSIANEKRADEKSTADEAVGAVGERKLLITRSNMDIILHGITHNRAWILLAVMAPFFEQLQSVLVSVVESIGFDFSAWVSNKSVFILTILLFGFAFVFFFIMSLLSVLGSILSLYDYKLSFGGGAYQRNSGLINKHEIQVKKSRIQSVRYIQNWMDTVLGRLVLILDPFSANVAQPGMASIMQKILVPSINDAEYDRLVRHVYPDFKLDKTAFSGISKYYLMRKFYFIYLPLQLVALVVPALLELAHLYAFSPLALLVMPLFYLRWRRYGWCEQGEFVVIRSGFIGVEYTCFPRFKVQQVKTFQSVFLKRKQLASVQFVLASSAITLPFVAERDAYRLADSALFEAEMSGRSWM